MCITTEKSTLQDDGNNKCMCITTEKSTLQNDGNNKCMCITTESLHYKLVVITSAHVLQQQVYWIHYKMMVITSAGV